MARGGTGRAARLHRCLGPEWVYDGWRPPVRDADEREEEVRRVNELMDEHQGMKLLAAVLQVRREMGLQP